jgi:hypothetical protein
VFRRRNRKDDQPEEPDVEREVEHEIGGELAVEIDRAHEASAELQPPSRDNGPWDVSEVGDSEGAGDRIDLGGMWLPGREGLELRLDVDESTQTVTGVTVLLRDGTLQVQPFAAPRKEGIWEGVRAEIAAGITSQGGTASIQDGPFGPEVDAKIPVQLPDGSSGMQAARFFGVDGPRWFLRGVISGAAYADREIAEALESLFRDVVVVRGGDPMAPRDPLPLHLPRPHAEPAGAEPERDQLNPFKRGPEITEVR